MNKFWVGGSAGGVTVVITVMSHMHVCQIIRVLTAQPLLVKYLRVVSLGLFCHHPPRFVILMASIVEKNKLGRASQPCPGQHHV
jgi:hypothetical protein